MGIRNLFACIATTSELPIKTTCLQATTIDKAHFLPIRKWARPHSLVLPEIGPPQGFNNESLMVVTLSRAIIAPLPNTYGKSALCTIDISGCLLLQMQPCIMRDEYSLRNKK